MCIRDRGIPFLFYDFIDELEKQFESGTLTEEELQSQRDSLNATRTNMKVEFSEVAAAQFAATGSVKGGEQAYSNSTLGSRVLVNATTGEQMTKPLTGHSGSMVCEGSVCGMDCELGKQASAFGGMYVLESLADKEGNVAGICSGGGCKFDVDTLWVLGPDGFANNVFNFLALSLLFLVLLVEIFMPAFVFLIAPGFSDSGEKLETTISLTRITFPFLIFVSLSSFFGAILNSNNKFAVASAAPIILNIFLILTLLFSNYLNDVLVYYLSYAVTIAGIVQLLSLIHI